MNGEYVLVIGSAVLDISGRTVDTLRPGMRQYGHIHASVSGVARNIAENLARLDINTVLLSAIADDDIGQHLITHSMLAGIDCSRVLRVGGARTATSMLLYHSDDSCTRVDDLSIAGSLDSDYLMEHEGLFEEAALVVIDATLPEEALDTLFELAMRHRARVCADPTSPLMASRLRRFIPNLYLIVPNASETAALCSLSEPATERDSAIGTAQQLVNMGANIAVVTLGEHGLAYADSSGGGYIRAIHTEVVDTAGAGDAFSGAVIFGILNDVPIDEAMRLGVTAASLTLESEDTVLQSLNQELLYDELSA
ncbi:MAG: PfkB family carbohydrate kinase [Chloroflexota bacterium]|nr:PfkB family carbohydrate kinase [Chloroflexota bacterium]MDE2855110.1 PfkB family carbohydrate kinase [Chloroflexota bacterium]MDE2947327.1 PfkB family carbohydrate kinase [Chloroflexota bacterium]